jgi:hypothetical protein
LTRREREFQQQRQAFLQEKQGMLSKSELTQLWKTDKNKFRESLGIPTEEWGIPEPKQEQEDPVSSLRKELDQMKQEAADRERTKAISEFKQNLGKFISQDQDQYELINRYGAVDTVYDFMVDYYRENRSEITPKDACDYVENYLFEQLKQGASTKKIGSLFQTSEQPGKQPSPTLTGSAASNPTTTTQRKLSPEESLAEAAKLIKWT